MSNSREVAGCSNYRLNIQLFEVISNSSTNGCLSTNDSFTITLTS